VSIGVQVFQPSHLFYTSFKDDGHSVGNLLCLGEVRKGGYELKGQVLKLLSEVRREEERSSPRPGEKRLKAFGTSMKNLSVF